MKPGWPGGEAGLQFNEAAGTELFAALGLRVPLWKVLRVSEEFAGAQVESLPGLKAGVYFGSRFLGANRARLYQLLPGHSLPCVSNRRSFWTAWLADICAEHDTEREALFVEDPDGCLQAFFVDHGHLFGGAGPQEVHPRSSRYHDARIYGALSEMDREEVLHRVAQFDADALCDRVRELPAEWKTGAALDGLEECIYRLTTRAVVSNILDRMVEYVEAPAV